jgi:hypothetical protein
MSSFDLTDQIRASRPTAPAALRERVRATAADAPAPSPRRTFLARLRTRRMAGLAPAVAALALVVAGVVGFVSDDLDHGSNELVTAYAEPSLDQSKGEDATKLTAPPVAGQAGTTRESAPAPTPGRLERYQATLRLRVGDAEELSTAQQQAVKLTRGLGGYVVSLRSAVPDEGTGSADIVVRVPRLRVQEAIAGFMELGTIVSQQVDVQDLQAQVDAMTDRIATLTAEIARIQRQLANPNLPVETRSRLSARLAADRRELRELRDGRAQTTREGQLATVSLALTTEKRASAAPASSRFDRALDQAAEVLAFEASALVLLLVAVGPLVLLGLLVWLGVRVTRRRADDRLLERA